MFNYKPRSFAEYDRAGFTESLLPAAPPGAALSKRSKIDPKSLGKIPTILTTTGFSGFSNWQHQRSTLADIERWGAWHAKHKGGINVCLRTDEFPALDIDVDDQELSGLLLLAISARMSGPVRRVRGPDGSEGARFLMLFAGEALPSWTTTFEYKGSKYMIELKGARRQCVVEGRHKSGGTYAWTSPHPTEIGADALCPLSASESEMGQAMLEEVIRKAGGLNLQRTVGGHGRKASGFRGQLLGEPAPSVMAIRHALSAVPNGDGISRDEWVKVAHNVKGASRDLLAEGLEAFMDWSEGYEQNTPEEVQRLWDTITPTTGWAELARWATRRSQGKFNSAVYEFGVADQDRPVTDELEAVFQNHLWVERQEGIYDLVDQRIRSKVAFNAHLSYLGPIWAREKASAWDYFLREPSRVTAMSPVARRKTVLDITYRPGEQPVCTIGRDQFLNQWRAPEALPDGPVSDADIEPWLSHVALIIPDETERLNFLGWMASVAQRQSEKPNHGIVIGGAHGIGKSILVLPLKAAVGRSNVTEMNVRALDDQFSDWLGKTKLFIVEEMMNFGKREMMQRLKTLLAAPPEYLTVNPKYGKRYEVPNIIAGIFFTNHEDAIAVEKGERRFMIFWSSAKWQGEEYYKRYMAWMANGGAAHAARWLLDYDASYYDMLGNAPATRGLEDMRKASRSKLDEWIEEGIEFGDGWFASDLIALDDLRKCIPSDVHGRFGSPSAAAFGSAMKRAGALSVARIRLGSPQAGASEPICDTNQARIFSLRRHEMYVGLANGKLAELYWQQRAKSQGAQLWAEAQDAATDGAGR